MVSTKARGESRRSKCSGLRVNLGRVKKPGLMDRVSDRAVDLRSFWSVAGIRLGEEAGEGAKMLLMNVGSGVRNSTKKDEAGGLGSGSAGNGDVCR